MKKILILMMVVGLILSMAGCNSIADNSVNEVGVDTSLNEQVDKDLVDKDLVDKDLVDSELEISDECMLVEQIPYTPVDVNKLPESVKNQVDLNRQDQGYHIIKSDEGTYLVVYMGERNSGGYAVEVDGIFDLGGGYTISVLETRPSENDMVTMAITYPLTVVKVDSDQLTEDNITINRYSEDNDLTGIEIMPLDEDFYITPIDLFKEGEVIITGDVVAFNGDTVHIMSGDLIQVFRSEISFQNIYLGEFVKLIKFGDTFVIESYLKDDFSVNHTNMGDIILTVKGHIVSIDGDNFTIKTESDELTLNGAEYLNVVEGETVEVEYIEYQIGDRYAIDVIKDTELYTLKVLGIKRMDNGMMVLEATDQMSSEEVSYVVTISDTTLIRLNLSEIKNGDTVKAYAEYVLESYPMQMSPKRITK